MKKIMLAAAVATVALVGCASKDVQNSRAMISKGKRWTSKWSI